MFLPFAIVLTNMIVTPIKTPRITSGSHTLDTLVDEAIPELRDGDIVAVSSKVVALCENNVRPIDTDREALIAEQSDQYLPPELSKYGHHFTIAGHTLVGSAGIDASNGDNHFVLWPADPQASANALRAHLQEHFGLQRVGVIITDSISQPLRLGTIGITIAHSGFATIHDYRGQPDLFDRPMQHVRANIGSGLAAATVLAMGEGNEQTPICIVRDAPFVTFQDHDPTPEELAEIQVAMDDDLFEPFFKHMPWRSGSKHGA